MPKKTTKQKPPFIKLTAGVKVLYCGHNASFIADVWETSDCILVRANGKIDDYLERPANKPGYWLSDFPQCGFWRPDIGVFLVPKNQFTKIK
jgi:hypothetical protein